MTPPDALPFAPPVFAPGRFTGLMASIMGGLRDAASAAIGRPPSDWSLWRAACQGDPDSARRLVRLLTPTALGLARQMLGRQEDAEDAVQESFLRLWSARPEDTHGAQLATYFHTIVLNRCRTQLVRRRELSTEPAELADLHDAQQSADADLSTADDPHTVTDRRQLAQALAQLPARQRMALAMWAYSDASAGDIARSLDIDTNAAHQLLHRAKRALRARLEKATP